MIDERLSRFDHIDFVSRKISGAIAGLRQVRRFVPQKTSITIHNSLITPLLIVTRIQNLQKSCRQSNNDYRADDN